MPSKTSNEVTPCFMISVMPGGRRDLHRASKECDTVPITKYGTDKSHDARDNNAERSICSVCLQSRLAQCRSWEIGMCIGQFLHSFVVRFDLSIVLHSRPCRIDRRDKQSAYRN